MSETSPMCRQAVDYMRSDLPAESGLIMVRSGSLDVLLNELFEPILAGGCAATTTGNGP